MKDFQGIKLQEREQSNRKISEIILRILDNQLGLKGVSLLCRIRHGKILHKKTIIILLVQPKG